MPIACTGRVEKATFIGCRTHVAAGAVYVSDVEGGRLLGLDYPTWLAADDAYVYVAERSHVRRMPRLRASLGAADSRKERDEQSLL